MARPLVEVQGLCKSFPIREGLLVRRTTGEVVAVDDVSFDIPAGANLGCVGGSGSGKSTLGRLILNLIAPDSGSVRLDGAELVGLPPAEMRLHRRDMQIVFQDPLHSLNPRRTVAGERRPSPPELRRDAAARVRELLDIVGLEPAHANRYPHEFSGGQCQRIAIARALALNPRFLFLDEPVSALDVSIQAQILNLLKDLQVAFNLTYLFVAHDLELVRYFSDRMIVLYHGRIVEAGESEEVYRNARHPYSRTLLESVLGIDGDGSWERAAERTGTLADDEDRESALRAAASAREGCIYAESCPEVFVPCRRTRPSLREVEPGHAVACHLFDSAEERQGEDPPAGTAAGWDSDPHRVAD